MTVWEFRALVRAYREWLGPRCPLGVARKGVFGLRATARPNIYTSARVLSLPVSFTWGVAAGWDGLRTESEALAQLLDLECVRGYRYGARLRRLLARLRQAEDQEDAIGEAVSDA